METVSDENKSLMWVVLKQLRPGMDLSRVVLPTFVLEPRSFLNKLSDYYYHADLLSRYASGRPRLPPPGMQRVPGRRSLPGRRPSGPPSQGSPAPSVPWHC